MSIPLIQKTRIGLYIIRQMLARRRRFPLVLMLEPLFRCNLRCKGCGKIALSNDLLNRHLSIAECVDAAEECRAPIVSIAGGEPLLHPDAPRIVRELTRRKKFVYLCTNAQLVARRLEEFEPSAYFTFNIHLDGLRERHDALVGRQGVYDRAVDAIRLLVAQGFRVTTNTTFFGGETPETASRFFDFLTSLGVEGLTVAPGFSYETAADQDHFLGRDGSQGLFRRIFEIGRGRNWRFNHSRLYLDFLAGGRNYACTPWGNPTRSLFGWQRPCYLINDGYAATYRELMETTDWSRYGVGRDPRCADCMVHCGFEATAVLDAVKNPLEALKINLRPPGGMQA
ncbi:MAG: adenosyl-hopene transferase HpnH [Desulfobacterales bacterium]|nr:MAG: adenosyl-hopene transferase HpnH [Desulfobacterales bacterium]